MYCKKIVNVININIYCEFFVIIIEINKIKMIIKNYCFLFVFNKFGLFIIDLV